MFGKLVWIIAAYITTAQSFYDKMQCANCSKINRDCKVKTTGWSCEFEVDARKFGRHVNSSKVPPFLQTCMPAGLGFVKSQLSGIAVSGRRKRDVKRSREKV
ncbi:uncharacterized protein LOC120448921 isoform X2 [Drosophila santomea]|uniref:uncharacterized protein LOC120448921 isoform X2 n=1 Tax=Drosophila santomea TaxID=129105 RepID=UPI001953E437|nr:uncharacterized protein LOC120448921 isoform X2 [Drosophila santomea]